jgi:hypothetical protein
MEREFGDAWQFLGERMMQWMLRWRHWAVVWQEVLQVIVVKLKRCIWLYWNS